MDLLGVLETHARQSPDRTALVDEQERVSYGELWDGVRSVAAHLLGLGIGTGNVVALAAEPTAPGIALLLGIIAAGATAAPLNIRLSANELSDYLRRVTPDLVLVDPPSEHVAPRGLLFEKINGRGSLLQRLGLPVATTAELPARAESAPAVALPTGGTTGIPKAALWSRRGLSEIVASNCIHLGVRAADRELYISPLFHVTIVAGFLPSLYMGASVHLLGRFDADTAASTFCRWRPTRMLSTPTAFSRLIASLPPSGEAIAGPLSVVYGASRSAPDFRETVLRKLPAARLITGYGATEYGPVARLFPEDEQYGISGAVGRPVAGALVRIIKQSDGTLALPGEIGELDVRAPWQMIGYIGTSENPFTADGSIRSGDLGWYDETGCLHLSGRLKEMIKSGGENVFPNEVEDVLQQHPAVLDVGVFGVDDDVWGERVEAAVVLVPGYAADPESLKTFCSERLAGFKVPKRFVFVESVPYTANMKLDRRRLQAEILPPSS